VRVSGTIESGVIIAEGITGAERIVTTAGGFLRDGEAVTIAPTADGTASTPQAAPESHT
jgi:hypothetical protein